jgi:hypothetical protein
MAPPAPEVQQAPEAHLVPPALPARQGHLDLLDLPVPQALEAQQVRLVRLEHLRRLAKIIYKKMS